jgi:hypothetical protein
MKNRDRMRRAREMAAELGDAARQKAEEVFDAAREGAEHLYEDASERAHDAWDHGYEAVEGGFDELHVFMKRQWRERPVVVAASAVAIGMLVGMAMRGGRR